MGELVNRGESAIVPEGFYKQVSSILNAARDKAYTAVNFAMVEAYWEIGKSIVDEQGGEERAKYGEALLKALAIRLTKDFGKGFEASFTPYVYKIKEDLIKRGYNSKFLYTLVNKKYNHNEVQWAHFFRQAYRKVSKKG